jgi:hypothetical protein
MCANGLEALTARDLNHSAPSGALHFWHEQLDETNGGDNVDRIQARPLVSGALGPCVLRVDGSIVDEDIDAAKRGTRLLRQRHDVVGKAQIGFDEHRARPNATQFIDELIATGFVSTVDGDGRALRCE